MAMVMFETLNECKYRTPCVSRARSSVVDVGKSGI